MYLKNQIFFCGLPSIETTEKALASSDEDSALGPDLVLTRFLKRCAKVLALVLCLVLLVILKFGNGQRYGRSTG